MSKIKRTWQVALEKNDLATLTSLIRAVPSCLHFVDKLGRNGLFTSIDKGYVDLAVFLLASGIEVDSKDNFDTTALMYAIEGGCTEIFEILLQAGADIEATNVHGWTPLMLASQRGRNHMVKTLLDVGADPNMKTDDSGSYTALMHACERGHLETVNILLNAHADPNIADVHGWTPLIVSSSYGRLYIVQALIEAGAKIDAHNQEGTTSLMRAACANVDVVHFLIEAGADLNKKDQDGFAALTHACFYNYTDISKIFLHAGSDINCLFTNEDYDNEIFKDSFICTWIEEHQHELTLESLRYWRKVRLKRIFS